MGHFAHFIKHFLQILTAHPVIRLGLLALSLLLSAGLVFLLFSHRFEVFIDGLLELIYQLLDLLVRGVTGQRVL